MNKNKKLGAIVTAVVIAGGLIFGVMSVEKINPGYVGVVYSISGGIEDDVLTQGWEFVGPTKKVVEYSIATEQLYMSRDKNEGSKDDDSFDIMCKDGKLNVDFEMSYRFETEKIPEVFTRYRGMSGEDIVNNIVRGKIKTYINEVTSQYSVLDAHLEKKGELNRGITEHLRNSLAEFGITVESANLTSTRPEGAVEEAITKRSAAAQELEAETLKQEQARKEAETIKIKAEGEAQAKIIAAEAESEANRLLQESITEELIRMREIEKWNGSKATTVVSGTDSTVVTP